MIIKILALSILSLMPFTSFAVGNAATGKTLSASCESCHGAYGISSNVNTPNLAGQHETYLVKQLQAFKTGTRANSSMQSQVASLTDQNIEDIAAYFASNAVLPRYTESATTGLVSMPFVDVFSTLYQAELEFNKNTSLFTLKSLNKR